MFESGHFLVVPAGALVCRMMDVKSVDGRRFALLDGGTNSSGIFGGSNAGRALACDVREGDLVVWWNQGAYGLTAAPTAFLSFPPPTEVFA
jgi:diaminopimelate decarboxylase